MRRLAALAALAALAGCGGDGDERAAAPAKQQQPVDVAAVGFEQAGSVAQFADCGDWKKGTREERLATIADIRGQHTPQRSETAASPLPDERAYAVFQEACEPDWADSLRLYKLYVKVQGFAPLSE
jgi:hypothetical protein